MRKIWILVLASVVLIASLAGCLQPPNEKPVAKATSNTDVIFVGEEVTFDANGSKDPDGSIKAYIWDFGDGATQEAKDKIVKHKYDKAGTYTINLTVKDDKGEKSKTVSLTITVVPVPVASTTKTDTNKEITFTLNTTFNPTLSVTWDFGDGNTGDGATVKHSYKDNGTYTVKVRVKSATGTEIETSLEVTILNVPPVANITLGPGPYYSNKAISFSGGSSTDSDGEIKNYTWDFGDEKTETGKDVSHTYLKPGNYTITLTVRDDDGAENSTSLNITIEKDLVVTKVIPDEPFNTTGNILKVNITVEFYNYGSAKNANEINITVISYATKEDAEDGKGDITTVKRTFDASVASNSKASVTVTNITTVQGGIEQAKTTVFKIILDYKGVEIEEYIYVPE